MEEKRSNAWFDDAQNRPTSCIRHPIVRKFHVVWLDNELSISNPDYEKKTQLLGRVFNNVNFFTDLNECVAFLEDVRLEKVYVIVSELLGLKFIPLIHTMRQVHAIYIFCNDEYPDEKWMLAWSKINGVYNRIESICEELELTAQQHDRNAVPVSFAILNENVDSSLEVNRLESSFMYTQLFKNTLLNMEHDEREMEQMVNYFRKVYAGNVVSLKKIDEFARDYCADKAVWWYTRETFIFEILNRALRLFDTEIIVNMGFFLHDLHRRIEQLHSHQIRNYAGKPFFVYRGQGLSFADFETLKKSEGGLISFNSFLSTSKKEAAPQTYAESSAKSHGMVGIFFTIFVDPDSILAPFANIRWESQFEDEEEILFTMHTVFRIGCIRCLNDSGRLFEVQLTHTTDDDTQLRVLTEQFSVELEQSVGWDRMARLLIQVGNLDKAEELYNVLLAQSTDEKDVAACDYQLGLIRDGKGDSKEAIRHYEKSLNIWEKDLPKYYDNLSNCLSGIGSVHNDMAEYSKALSFYEKALEIRQAYLPENHSRIALSYGNIAFIYENMGEYEKALFFLEKALEIRQTILPANHPSLATSYNKIGSLYQQMQQHVKALALLEKALVIQQIALPACHSDFAISYNNIGIVYQEMDENSKAVYFFEKALDIWQKALPENHPSLPKFYNNLGTVYTNMGEYSKALSFFEKGLLINQAQLPEIHPSIAVSYNNIGGMYDSMKAYSKACFFYERALDIWQKVFPVGHPVLATAYNNIAGIYSSMGKNKRALLFYEKSLEITQACAPENHAELAVSFNNMAVTYMNMNDYSKALSFYEKALELWQKTPLESHSSLATFYKNVGFTYANLGDHSNTMYFYEKALNIYRERLPENHLTLADLYMNIGMSYTDMNNHINALPFYEKALDIYEQVSPENHLILSCLCSNIGIAFYHLEDYSKSRFFLLRSSLLFLKLVCLKSVSLLTTFIRVLRL